MASIPTSAALAAVAPSASLSAGLAHTLTATVSTVATVSFQMLTIGIQSVSFVITNPMFCAIAVGGGALYYNYPEETKAFLRGAWKLISGFINTAILAGKVVGKGVEIITKSVEAVYNCTKIILGKTHEFMSLIGSEIGSLFSSGEDLVLAGTYPVSETAKSAIKLIPQAAQQPLPNDPPRDVISNDAADVNSQASSPVVSNGAQDDLSKKPFIANAAPEVLHESSESSSRPRKRTTESQSGPEAEGRNKPVVEEVQGLYSGPYSEPSSNRLPQSVQSLLKINPGNPLNDLGGSVEPAAQAQVQRVNAFGSQPFRSLAAAPRLAHPQPVNPRLVAALSSGRGPVARMPQHPLQNPALVGQGSANPANHRLATASVQRRAGEGVAARWLTSFPRRLAFGSTPGMRGLAAGAGTTAAVLWNALQNRR